MTHDNNSQVIPPAPIPGLSFKGPYPVSDYITDLIEAVAGLLGEEVPESALGEKELKELVHKLGHKSVRKAKSVQIFGTVTKVHPGKIAVAFYLDGPTPVRLRMDRKRYDDSGVELQEGVQVVAAVKLNCDESPVSPDAWLDVGVILKTGEPSSAIEDDARQASDGDKAAVEGQPDRPIAAESTDGSAPSPRMGATSRSRFVPSGRKGTLPSNKERIRKLLADHPDGLTPPELGEKDARWQNPDLDSLPSDAREKAIEHATDLLRNHLGRLRSDNEIHRVRYAPDRGGHVLQLGPKPAKR